MHPTYLSLGTCSRLEVGLFSCTDIWTPYEFAAPFISQLEEMGSADSTATTRRLPEKYSIATDDQDESDIESASLLDTAPSRNGFTTKSRSGSGILVIRILAAFTVWFLVLCALGVLVLVGIQKHDPTNSVLISLLGGEKCGSARAEHANVTQSAADQNFNAEFDSENTRNMPLFSKGYGNAEKVPECARGGSRAETFLMIFMGHSGSSAILSELKEHSQTITADSAEPIDHGAYEYDTPLALKFTREFFEKGLALDKTAGFKMRPHHIMEDPAAWAALAKKYNTRIIWQYRINLFKKAVGEWTRQYLNDTSVIEGLRGNMTREERCKIGAGCQFSIEDFDFFHKLLKAGFHSDQAISSGVDLVANGSSCIHAVPYEDYLYNRETSMAALQKFLGLLPEDHLPLRHKATNDNLCETVTNWKELCANFYGCHAWRLMLDDPENNCRCDDFTSGHVRYCATER